ncbi:hypothetical protein [Prosthecobacter sp.]|uniref:hypothetical protein n=1 Tax=Prosthecobacter sp. TaxID=1965333 RepID=UPI003783197E
MALSTHTGGAADKAGMIHESLWGVHCLLEVLKGEAESICIEEPGEDGEEFYLVRKGKKEHWQAKRQVTGQATWTINKLGDVLKYFFAKFRLGETSVFASVTDAPELRMLTENARAAQVSGGGLDQFKKHFVEKKRAEQFAEIKKLVGASSEEEAFGFLCSVTLHGGREITMEVLISNILTALFQPPWQATIAVLNNLYVSKVHETLTATDIDQHLQTCQISRRRSAVPDAKNRVQGLTRDYVTGQRAKLIRGTAIRRAAAAEMVTQIQSSSTSLDILITAAAGGGKSACLCQVVEGLLEIGLPVLAFRLDRLEPVPTVTQLGERLGLQESPAFVLSETFPNQPVVLVVDQLDCVSTTSGRHPDFFDTVASLHAEVIGLRGQRIFHLVLACRKFDFEHDYRLKRLVNEKKKTVEISLLSSDEVRNVLQREGGDFSRLTLQQQAMLCLPQNLSLYVEAGLMQSENHFSTAKDLCDAYWNVKRRAVSHERPQFDQHWNPALQHLTQRMSARQELSVPAAEMDAYPPEFLERMGSEGVLSWDGKRYGFGHETFFDYCFARTQPNGGRDFVVYLESDKQDLFRRAQLRQVITFLRDGDFSAYLASMDRLLKSTKVRPHLKLLAVELMAAHPQPQVQELELLMPTIRSEIKRKENDKKVSSSFIENASKWFSSKCGWWLRRRERIANALMLASRIWDCFFTSHTLFVVADQKGIIGQWLNSQRPSLQDMAANYLRWQTEKHAERVAELLEPFIGDETWRQRFRFVMEGRNLDKSRRFFELFLQLLTVGAVDEAKDRFVSNGTFWSMLHGLAEQRPEWCAELAACWMDRQVRRASSTSSVSENLSSYFNDGFGVNDLCLSARAAPQTFLQHVVPAILRSAEIFKNETKTGRLTSDKLWPGRFLSHHLGILEAYPSSCETALRELGRDNPDLLRPFICQLRTHQLYTANHLLMNAYLSNPKFFAEEALKLLTTEPMRLRCGFVDSSYWVSCQVIQNCSPHCTEDTFQELEIMLLAFVPSWERSKEGFRHRGHAAYNFVSSLAPDRLSRNAKSQLAEWDIKFKKPDSAPSSIRVYTIESPIGQDAARHMTDEQWLQAMNKYDSEERTYNHLHPEHGGAFELARMLQKFTEEEPERFSSLALRFPANVHPYYFSLVLSGIFKATISPEQKLAVARRVFEIDHHDCFRSALNILGAMGGIDLPEDAVQYIKRAACHRSPESGADDCFEGDLLNCGINTVRGFAAGAIRDLVWDNRHYLSIFRSTIEQLVKDSSLSVRACVASTLMAVWQHDTTLALQWFEQLLTGDDHLLETHYVDQFISQRLSEHLDDFIPVIKRMLQSSRDKVRETGASLACLARFYHEKSDTLSSAALNGDARCRMGACAVANDNLLNVRCRKWCETALARLFNDENDEVRRKAAHCFWHLWQSPDTPLSPFDALIRSFVSSPAFADEPTFLLYALKENHHLVPEVVLDICESFITRCGESARDVRTANAANEITMGELVFTAYAQFDSPALRQRALNVIDCMILEGLYSAKTHLADFER